MKKILASLATMFLVLSPVVVTAQTNYDDYYNDDYYNDSYYNDYYDYDYDSGAAEAAGAAIGIGLLIVLGISAVIGLIVTIFNVWMIIDCAKRDFENRTLWLVLLIVGLFAGFGWIASIVYFFVVKRKNVGAKASPAAPVQKQ